MSHFLVIIFYAGVGIFDLAQKSEYGTNSICVESTSTYVNFDFVWRYSSFNIVTSLFLAEVSCDVIMMSSELRVQNIQNVQWIGPSFGCLSAKSLQLKRLSTLIPTRGIAPGPCRGLCFQTPVIGSRYLLTMSSAVALFIAFRRLWMLELPAGQTTSIVFTHRSIFSFSSCQGTMH